MPHPPTYTTPTRPALFASTLCGHLGDASRIVERPDRLALATDARALWGHLAFALCLRSLGEGRSSEQTKKKEEIKIS